jgi:iron complex outermembrane recepter protein
MNSAQIKLCLGVAAIFAAMPVRADSEDTATIELHEATVHAAPRASSTQGSSKLEGALLARRLGRSLGDALTAVEGVTLLQSGPTIAKPEIRGLQGNRIQILNNGVKLEGQQWGSEHAPEIDPFLAGSMTVIKGAAGVRYGPEALGGVVLVTPRPLRRSPGYDGEWHALATTAGWGGATALRYDVAPASAQGLALRVQGTVRRLGDQKTPDYVLANTALAEQNGMVAVGYGREDYHLDAYYSRFHTELGILRAAHIGNLSDLETALARERPEETGPFGYGIDRPRQEVTHDLVKLQGGRHFDAGHLEVSWALQNNERAEYDKDRPLNDSLAALDRPELLFRIYTHSTEVVFEHAAHDGFTGEVGFAGTLQGNASQGRTFVPNFMNYAGGVFAMERWNGPRWGAEAGLRYDARFLEVFRSVGGTVRRSTFTHDGLSAAAGTSYRRDSTLARVNVSMAWRAPSASELYSNGVHHGAAAVEYGDTSLGAETAWNGALSLRHGGQGGRSESGARGGRQTGLRETEIELFATYIADYIGLIPDTPATLTIRGAFPTFRYRATDALLYGAEARAVWITGSTFDVGVRGSLLWTEDRHTGAGLLFVPSHRAELSLKTHVPERGGLIDPFVEVRAQTVWTQTNPPVNDYAPPPPGFTLLHAEAGFGWETAAGPLDVELQVRNALNTAYRENTNRFRYYADETGREVALRLKLTFGSP